MAPEEQLNAFLLVEKNKWDILAVYHSHPQGIDAPSFTDYEELTYPGIIYLIWFKRARNWNCKAYLMYGKSKPSEVPLFTSAT
jgi:proteasome lid subunit RPN8/RPN11